MPKQPKHQQTNATHNMPQFQRMQYAFAGWIRKPDPNQTPQNIERRRMDIYRELFFNNVAGFLENAFPVAARTLGQKVWQGLVQGFFEQHRATSPYFREIPQEFMAWLMESPSVFEASPPWLLELLHYEWLELYLSTLDAPWPEFENAAVTAEKPVALSPFFMMAAYRWPVQTISLEHQPTIMPTIPTLLAVYRTKAHKMRFMQLTPKAALLLEALQQNPLFTLRQAAQKAHELAGEHEHEKQAFSLAEFADLFADLQQRDIFLGTAKLS